MRAPLLVRLSLAALAIGFATAPAPLPAQDVTQEEAAARRMMLEAERRTREGDDAGALRDYALVVERFADQPQAAEALVHLAEGRWRRGDAEGAESAARHLVSSYGSSRFAAGGYAMLGEIAAAAAVDRQGLERARTTFRDVWLLYDRGRFPAVPWRAQARVRSGEIALLLGEFETAAGAFVACLEDEPRSEWTARAALGLSAVALARGESAAAARELQRLVDRAASADGPEVRLARQRLTLIHRLVLRAAAGSRRWLTASDLRLPGVEVKKPAGVAADESGRVAVTDPSGLQALLLSAVGGTVTRQTYPKLGRPAFSHGGAPRAAAESGIVGIADRETQPFADPKKASGQPLDDLVTGIRTALGDWWLLLDRPRQVLLFGAGGDYRRALTDPDEIEALDLATDPLGRLYVLDGKANRVLRYAVDGARRETVARGDWRRPEAVAADSLGNVYVLDRGDKRIEVFDAAGGRLDAFGPTLPGGLELESPRDLAVDGAGRLLIADVKRGSVIVVE